MKLVCSKRNAILVDPEIITSGSVGMPLSFEFSADWDGLSKTAVFSNGALTKDVILSTNEANIPHEVCETPWRTLTVGVYGTNGGTIVIPTIYCVLGTVYPGADPSGDESTDPTLPVWAQLQAEIEEKIGEAPKNGRQYARKNGGWVPVEGGGGGAAVWGDIEGTLSNQTDLAQALSEKADAEDVPTESTVAGWGFTKNTGTYSKPSSGIPKTDLSDDVQGSLGKADSALQEHQDISGLATKTEVAFAIASAIGDAIGGSY